MRRGSYLAAIIAPGLVLASGVVGAQSAVNPANPALDGAPRMRADRNRMHDIKVADPAEQMTLIAPPGANNEGDAALTYPLALPPGRRGMEPSLALRYRSSAGGGWVGVGWDLAVPSVSIETRWGVPRYDPTAETESYLVGGEQLTPLAHRGPLQARAAEKTFQPRIEGEFDRIVRHGNTPANYWWEVTDKKGVRYVYGDAPGDPIGSHTLRDDSGNIFRWALRSAVDLTGNGVTYAYALVVDTGVTGGAVPGYQLYPSRIDYTQSGSAAGPYSVAFVRDRELGAPRRKDVTIDARGGFKMVTADLLKQVVVTFGNQVVRRYDLDYTTNAHGQSLLSAVSQRGEDLSLFHTHRFDYYDEPLGFGAAESWSAGSDGVGSPALGLNGAATTLGGSITIGGGGHVYLGFNPDAPEKEGSFGGKIGFNISSNDGVEELIDVNGDGLPDKVYKTLEGVFVRFNQSGPGGGTSFGPVVALPSLPAISSEQTVMIGGGVEAYMGVSAMLNFSETFSIGSKYFADVNGDGLLDLVVDGQVLFNHYDGNGAPYWSADSSTTPVPVSAGAVDASGVVPDYESSYQRQIDMSPLADTVRRWVAPYDGVVDIGGAVALVQSADPARAQYQTADGVRVAIQKNGSELWSTQIGATDYGPHTPTGVSGLQVHAGDRIYFRVQSIFDGSYDQVAWAPVITYAAGTGVTDVNGLDPYRFDAAADFVYAGRPHSLAKAPFNGTVHIAGNLIKSAVTTDDVTMMLLVNGQPALQQTLAADQIGTIVPSGDIAVSKGDKLELRVAIDSPITLSAIQWNPSLYYASTPDVDNSGNPIPVFDAQGNPIVELHLGYDEDQYPVDGLAAPQAAWTAPSTGTVTVTPQITGQPDATGTIVFTVKRPGARLAKQSITMTAGIAAASPVVVDVNQGDAIYFDFSVADPVLAGKISGSTVTVGGSTVPSAVHGAGAPGLFPVAYRGWSVAGYNGNREYADLPIDESRFTPPSDNTKSCDTSSVQTQDDFLHSSCNPSGATSWASSADPSDGIWRGVNKSTWVAAGVMSSSRAAAPFVSVPRPGQYAGAGAVNRTSHTTQIAVGAGIGPLAFSVTPLGLTDADMDFVDLNGDGFPDIVGNGRIQYTSATGGLEGQSRSVAGFDGVRENLAFSEGVGISGAPAGSTANARGRVGASAKGSPKGNKSGGQMPAFGLGGNLGLGQNNMQSELMDVNGDGLPDRVYHSLTGGCKTAGACLDGGGPLMVALNLGYGFAPPEPWGEAAINQGASANLSVGISPSFNDGDYGYAGGVSIAGDVSQAACKIVDPIFGNCGSPASMLLDVNGDGLPDRVSPNPSGSSLRVALNSGSGFLPEVDWYTPLGGVVSRSRNLSMGGGAYFTIPVGPLCVAACYLIVNPGFDIDVALGRQEVSLVDVDGDGYPDHVTSSTDGDLTVARNQRGRTGLLRSITRPLGATVHLEYERDGNTFAQPHSRWVLTRVSTHDGHPGDGVDTRETTFTYGGGSYNRLEREFYGYAQVIEEERDASHGDALYRSTVRQYQNDSFYGKGLLISEATLDAAGRPFVQTAHTYDFRDVGSGGPADVGSTTATVFPMLVRTDKLFFEGSPTPGKSTYSTFAYDAFGRITQLFNAADEGLDDDAVVTTNYASCASTHVLGVPTQVVIADGRGAVMRHNESTVDCGTGLVTQARAYADASSAAATDTAYYPNGNVERITFPANANGERFQLAYAYDTTTATYATQVTDSFGYVSTSTYDLAFGKVQSATDPNHNTTSFTYDVFGRVTSVRAPYEQGGGAPTASFEYHPEAQVPWAITRRFDAARPAGGTIDSVTFIDGLRREIQTKETATLFAGPALAATDVMVVSGARTFDHAGRVTETRYPTVEPLGTAGVFNATIDAVPPEVVTHDVLDRVRVRALPDGTRWSYDFGFGSDHAGAPRFVTVVTDPMGIDKLVYRDVRSLVIAQKELNKGGTEAIWTSYAYDAMERVTDVIDDHGNATLVAYDQLGRRTAINSPDSGYTELGYDLAGNLVSRATANLHGSGQAVAYHYAFNRMTDIVYPLFPENDVHYTYGAPGAAGNGAEEIVRVDDASGYELRSYGKLGEITQNVRAINDKPSHGGWTVDTWTTQFTYDSFGRMLAMTYPDGEVLTYAYDSGGLVRALGGVKGQNAYTYASRLEYDKFGATAFIQAGNGVQTQSAFDPVSRQLANLQAGKGGALFQNVSYTYDAVGDVLSLTNNIPVPPSSQYNGPSTQTFGYDDLHRLNSATSNYWYSPTKSRAYTMAVTYDTIHNITRKAQTDTVYNPPKAPLLQANTTYTNDYVYGAPQPHAVTHVDGRTFTYDVDGNQTGWTDDKNGNRRNLVWTEDDRIDSLADNGSTTLYHYNDAGDRVWEHGPQGETIYISDYYTVKPGSNAMKHFFAGPTRIASKIVNATLPEVKQFFLHPDHLGNTTYVTDVQGFLYQHLEYFPFGEAWIEDNSDTSNTPYLFAGKELDGPSALYYFGARYYDARTSVWQSPDPALADFLAGGGAGGVLHPPTLGLYGYAQQNPLRFTDPDGRAVLYYQYNQIRKKGAPAADVFNLISGTKSKWAQNSGERAGAPPGVGGADEITLVIRSHGVGGKITRDPETGKEEKVNAVEFAKEVFDQLGDTAKGRVKNVVLLVCHAGKGIGTGTEAEAFFAERGITLYGANDTLHNTPGGELYVGKGRQANKRGYVSLKKALQNPKENLTPEKGFTKSKGADE
jgi:RHS repeat-associated protein